MKAYRITPCLFDRIWGGEKLKSYGKNTGGGRLGESWELSFTEGGISTVGDLALTARFPRESWGTCAARFERFPVLTKFIDAAQKLSVQVHPSDDYALQHEGGYGKTEMWYIIDCEPGAGLYLGLREPCTLERFARAIEEGTVEELLAFVPVAPGDVYFIPSGTLHAIGGGVLLYEIQQNSDLTYRVYDYGRRDPKTGMPRPLHVEKALQVADLSVYHPIRTNDENQTVIGKCAYFKTELYKLNFAKMMLLSDESSYLGVTAVRGEGEIDGQKIQKGDTFFIPAASGEVAVEGDLDLIVVSTPE